MFEFDSVVPNAAGNLLLARRDAQLASIANQAPRVPWDAFLARLQWRHGEHFTLIGPTGQGKTTMLLHLLELHPFVTVFATKPRDKTMDQLISHGYEKFERWYAEDARQSPRRVLWPDARRLDSVAYQRRVFGHAFAAIYREGGWTLAIDELWYFANVLKLGPEVKLYLLQARALGISLLSATQRPANVPVEVYDQSTHLMFWRDNDETNLKRISGISWRSSNLIRYIIANLEPFQVLYINTRTGEMLRTRCPAPEYAPMGGETPWLRRQL